MRLQPSRIRSKYVLIAALSAFLLFVPFSDTIEYVIITTAEKFFARPGERSILEKHLEIENIALKIKIKEGEELKKENEKLKQILKFQEQKKTLLIGAEVIAFDPSSWRRQVILNRGKRYGVKKGMYVIDDQGALIGKISESTQNYCKLSLLSDPDFSMPVFVGESSLGLLEGGLDRVKVLYIENSENVKNGDLVWCKPLGVTFVIPIGQIKNATALEGSMFQQIEVKISAEHPNLRTVYILR